MRILQVLKVQMGLEYQKPGTSGKPGLLQDVKDILATKTKDR
jgi:hypothetical protein